MGQYNKAVLTAAGEKLIARALAGEIKLRITQAKTSDYAYPDSTNLKSLKDMQGIKQTVHDPETTVLNNTMIQTRVLFSNEKIASTYYIHNIGLYAMDGTEEVLFCIVTAETPDEMPQYNGVASTSYIYNIQNVVEGVNELQIVVNSSGTATIQDVMERVKANGGDISETVIEKLETIEDKYALPAAGESVNQFFGKVLTFLRNIRPLTTDLSLYVSASKGSDIEGDGTDSKPYASIGKALSVIPKNLNGYNAVIDIAGGIYSESVNVTNYINGSVQIQLSGNISINDLTVNNAYLICKTEGNIYQITLAWISVTSRAILNAWASVNWNTTSYKTADGRNISILLSSAKLYMSGNISLIGNNDVAIRASVNATAYLAKIYGTGFAVGFYAWGNSRIDYAFNGLNATTMYSIDNGGLIVQSSGAVIGSLQHDIGYYVATTGSDTTGDGTVRNPFRTIQHAINMVPPNLNGYGATIQVADGLYDEDILVAGLTSGIFYLKSSHPGILSSATKIRKVRFLNNSCNIVIDGFEITTSTVDGLLSQLCTSVLLNSIKCVTSGNYAAGTFYETPIFRVYNCEFSNRAHAIFASNSSGYMQACIGTGNVNSIYSVGSSIVHIISTQPSGNVVQVNSGMVINENGTQISSIISSGLSCTWATIQGGYYRIGNLHGVAQVIVQFRLVLTTNITGGTHYVIDGLPPTANGVDIAGYINLASQTLSCYMSAGGQLRFASKDNTLIVGSAIAVNLTYITNS